MIINKEQVDEIKDIMGVKFPAVIERYLTDVDAQLAEIDICMAACQYGDIGQLAHQLKSSSFHVGAIACQKQAELIDHYIRNNKDDLASLPVQTRLDVMISQLRSVIFDYKVEIQKYL